MVYLAGGGGWRGCYTIKEYFTPILLGLQRTSKFSLDGPFKATTYFDNTKREEIELHIHTSERKLKYLALYSPRTCREVGLSVGSWIF